MHLTDHDFRQLGRDAPPWFGEDVLPRLAERFPGDLRHARDHRWHPDFRNGSRLLGGDSLDCQAAGASERALPTGTQPDEPPTVSVGEAEGTKTPEPSNDETGAASEPRGASAVAAHSPERRPGAPGSGRTDKLSGNAVFDHLRQPCAVCGETPAADAAGQGCGGYDEVGLLPADPDSASLQLRVSERGTRAFALLASIMSTRRATKAFAQDDRSRVLHAGRQGRPARCLAAVSAGG
jgi:hypothetical protein